MLARHPRTRRWIRRRRNALVEILYAGTIQRWGWWPLRPPRIRAPRKTRPASPRVAYFTWRFPVLSQTFVRREVKALRQRGLPLTVFAQGAEDVELMGDEERALLTTTRYVEPVDEELLARYKKRFRRERPLVYLNLFLFVMSRRYGLSKSIPKDRSLFDSAVYLAGQLRDQGVDRVHSPWGDRSGFIALMAAALLDVPFSIQVRAHDIHDPSYHDALPDMLENADFIITNTRYNRPYVFEHRGEHGPDVHTIYNGLDLSEFDPPPRPFRVDGPVRLLCVARLIEQKGLTYLLEACARLRDRGFSFTCEVIGGAEHPLYTDYLVRLMDTHARLELEHHVHFRGAQPFAGVMDAYRSSDIFVLPCVVASDGRRDITPNSLIEAMAMKLTVVSTAITGITEIVEHGVSGWLVPPEQPAAIVDAIELLHRSPDLARALGENARKRVESRFDVEANVQAYLELFRTASAEAL